MKQYEILKKIGIIINELQEQYEFTDQNKEDLNDLELELFAANAHYLMEHLEILRKLNTRQVKALPPPVEKPEHKESFFEPIVHTETNMPPANFVEFDVPKQDIPTEDENTPVIEFTEPEREEPAPEPIIRHELVIDETVAEDDEDDFLNQDEVREEEILFPKPLADEYNTQTTETTVENIPEELGQPKTEPEIVEPPVIIEEPEVIKTQVIIEDPETEKPLVTINQMISAQISHASRYGEQTELQSIKDLKSAINLNDKLLFVRDLFNGYSMAYSEAIEILNRFNKFEEADQFLKVNYYTKNNWEAKQATTDKFYELLHRRFA